MLDGSQAEQWLVAGLQVSYAAFHAVHLRISGTPPTIDWLRKLQTAS